MIESVMIESLMIVMRFSCRRLGGSIAGLKTP
jgi:hypothetical protein